MLPVTVGACDLHGSSEAVCVCVCAAVLTFGVINVLYFMCVCVSTTVACGKQAKCCSGFVFLK